ncbi:MAG: hydrogen peroxide-inducible genes activator [Gammaproteobacteria bacterium]|nr:hydrogen peroxide-inducible genes activator [Gammaproteobacteria bacterium]
MIKYPTIKQLRYFVALCEEGHFGRAAARSFVSQSAFSTAIQDLESLLGTQLVDRTRRQVTVTAIGQEVETQARLCLRDVEILVEMAGQRQQPLTGPLHLGVIPTIAPFMLPGLMPRLRRKFQRLKLFLVEDQTEHLHERLLAGELDLLLLALPYEMRSTETMSLFRDRFCLALRDGSKIVDPENYRFNRLQSESILLLEDGHCLRDHALAACRIRNTEKVARFAASSLLTLVEMIDADLGISFLPEMALGSSLLKNTRVRMYPLSDRSYREIGLVWRKGSDRADEFRMFGEYVRSRYP